MCAALVPGELYAGTRRPLNQLGNSRTLCHFIRLRIRRHYYLFYNLTHKPLTILIVSEEIVGQLYFHI